MSLKLATFFYLLAIATATRSSRAGKYRIIGGSEARPYEFPHMVALDRGDSLSYFCGGGILNEYWVITAGHCAPSDSDDDRFRIRAGKHSLYIDESTEQDINIAKVFVYEKFPGGTGGAPHDIALLKLEKPLVLNKYVKPIALPERHSKVVGEVIFSGWGATEYGPRPHRLQKARMTVTDFDACKKADIFVSGSPSGVTDTMVCTRSATYNIFACMGDSGSPLIKQENHKTYLVGVFSWIAQSCGRKRVTPSVFTKVSSYVDWIKNTMSNN